MNDLQKEFEEKFCTKQQMQYLATQIITLDNLVVRRNTDANDVWLWIEQKLKEARIDENKKWEIAVVIDKKYVDEIDFQERIRELEGEIK